MSKQDLIKKWNEKYPERKHFWGQHGPFFSFKKEEDLEKAIKNDFDTSYYSGSGCILKCKNDCGNRDSTRYLGVLHITSYISFELSDFKFLCQKCYEKREKELKK